MIRDLYGTIANPTNAIAGVFITLNKSTKGIKDQRDDYGKWKLDFIGSEMPKMRVVTIQEILNGTKC